MVSVLLLRNHHRSAFLGDLFLSVLASKGFLALVAVWILCPVSHLRYKVQPNGPKGKLRFGFSQIKIK
jgi:hypothetical protein